VEETGGLTREDEKVRG